MHLLLHATIPARFFGLLVLFSVGLATTGCATVTAAQPQIGSPPLEVAPVIVDAAVADTPAPHDDGADVAAFGDVGQTPVWVATHTTTMLWDGPGADASSRGRLPVGSYFLVLGDAVTERLPVRYLGNGSTPAGEGWVDLTAIGPIPEPAADWTEPDWPPRRLVLGQRTEIVRGDPALPMIALTFDAGAGSGAASRLLDVLRDRGVRATFFVTGAFADRYEAIVRRIAAEGHEIANHSYNHPDFRTLSDDQMRVEIRRGTASVESAAGVRIAPLWRPPFGSRDDRVLRVVEQEGFRAIYWTFDSGDWLDNATTDRVRDADLRQAVPGAIVVHHVSPDATANAMPTIIDELRGRGYELVTVGELIGP
jgi:peptidoglycan/xylan/chitin deacetylase (PgdA/CDA1 family)